MPNQEIAILPQPVKTTRLDGVFPLDSLSLVAANGAAKPVAALLSEQLSSLTGRPVGITDETEGKDRVSLRLSEEASELGEEGYRLTVKPSGVSAEAPAPAGLYYACQTLLQLAPVDGWAIPCCRIEDYPRCQWRGSLLDACRHFWSVADTQRYIDLLAMHKMNVLHWHLTEDQGWRIQIEKYPKLTEAGAWRKGEDGGKYGGFYTQDEIREVVAYAAGRGVTVVPEIEMPGHAIAALAAYPELSCAGGPFEVRTAWGVAEDVYCAGNEKVFEFLENVLLEVMDLFPSRWIHVGGDECPKKRWEECPKCQRRIQDEGLSSEFELQKYFINRIDRFLASHGRVLIGWDEILESRAAGVGHKVEIDYSEDDSKLALTPSAMVQSWRGMAGGIAAARKGHDVIMSPTTHCYLDYGVEGLTTAKAYSFEPVPEELDDEAAAHILGLEGTLWTEHIADRDRLDYQAFPRLCALAEAAWTPQTARNWENFRLRLKRHGGRLARLGVQYWRDPEVW